MIVKAGCETDVNLLTYAQLEYTTYLLWLPGQEKSGHQIINIMMSQACWSVKLTHYDCQGRIKNGHGIFSIFAVTETLKYTTYML